MSDALYSKALLRLAADAHGAGRLDHPDATGTAHNPTCGDKVVVDLALAGSRVARIALEAKACVLTQASASILGQHLSGTSRDDVVALHDAVNAMLESGGAPPAPPFEAYGAFSGAVEFAGRHRCVLLPIEAVLDAFERSMTA